MAVTNEKSAQLNKAAAVDGSDTEIAVIDMAKVRLARFDFTQGAAAGDAASTAKLVQLGGGRVRILPTLSRLAYSAFGAARTLDIGVAAHTSIEGAAVNAVADNILDGLDVSAAGAAALGTGTNGLGDGVVISSGQGGIMVVATVAGGTIPAAATLKGWIAYVRD